MFRWFRKKQQASSIIPEQYLCDIGWELMVLPVTDSVGVPSLAEEREKPYYCYEWTTLKQSLSKQAISPHHIIHPKTGKIDRQIEQYTLDESLQEQIVTWVSLHLEDQAHTTDIHKYAIGLIEAMCFDEAPANGFDLIFYKLTESQKLTLFRKAFYCQPLNIQQEQWVALCCQAIQKKQTHWLSFLVYFLHQSKALKRSFYKGDTKSYEFNDSAGRSLLMRAASVGSVESCEILYSLKIDINQLYHKDARLNEGETALSFAVMCNQYWVVQWLLDRGAHLFMQGQSLNSKSIYCRTIMQNNMSLLTMLLSCQDDVVYSIDALKYALNFCVFNQKTEAFHLLLSVLLSLPAAEVVYEAFVGITIRYLRSALELIAIDKGKTTLLMRIAKTGNRDIFLYFLQEANESKAAIGKMHQCCYRKNGISFSHHVVHDVVKHMDLACLKALLDSEENANQQIMLEISEKPSGYRALELAIVKNKSDMVAWLLSKEVSILPSTLACALESNIETCQLVLAYFRNKKIPIFPHNLDVNLFKKLLYDPASAEKLMWLLSCELSLQAMHCTAVERETFKATEVLVPLFWIAARFQPLKVVRKMYEMRPNILEETVRHDCHLYYDFHPVTQAARYNTDPAVSVFLYESADLKVAEPEQDGTTYFSWWFMRGMHNQIAKFLDDQKDEDGQLSVYGKLDSWKWLHLASYYPEALLPLDSIDLDGCVEELNSEAGYGLTPLYIAMLAGNTEKAEYLIHAGASLYIQDKAGNTFLHYCAYTNAGALLPYLETDDDKFLFLDVKNHSGKTALDIAYDKQSKDVFFWLIWNKAELGNIIDRVMQDENEVYAELLLSESGLEQDDKKTLSDMLMFQPFFKQVRREFEQHQHLLLPEVKDRYYRLVLAIEHILHNRKRYLENPHSLFNQTNITIKGQFVPIHFEYNLFSESGNLSMEDYFYHLFNTLKIHHELYLAQKGSLAWFNNLPEGLCIDARINILAEEILVLQSHLTPHLDQLLTAAWLARPIANELDQVRQEAVIEDIFNQYGNQDIIFSVPGGGEEIIRLSNTAEHRERVTARLVSFIS